MGKFTKSIGLALLSASLVAGPALAGITAVNHVTANTPFTVSLEIANANRVALIGPAGGLSGISFLTNQAISSSNIFQITLAGGAAFGASTGAGNTTYRICGAAGLLIGQTSIANGATTANFQVDPGAGAIASGTLVHLTDLVCAADPQDVLMRLNATTTATTGTIKIDVLTASFAVIDPGTTANLFVVRSEYTPTVTNSNHVIDVVTVGANGNQFTAATGRDATGGAGTPIVLADSGFVGVVAPGSVRINTIGNSLTDQGVAGVVTVANVIVSGDFSGVSRIFLAASGTACNSGAAVGTPGNLVQSAANPTSPATLLVPAATFAAGVPAPAVGASANVDLIMCVLVNGTTFLNPRVLSASVDINVTGTGVNDPAATATAAVQTWVINGAELRLTGVKGAPTGNDTIISINNLGTTLGSIRRLEVYQLDATANAATPACVVTNVPTGTAAGQFSLFALAGNTIRASGLVTNLCSGQAPFVTGASAQAYGLRLVLDVAPGNISTQATRTFPGIIELLSIPVLKNPPPIPGVPAGSQHFTE